MTQNSKEKSPAGPGNETQPSSVPAPERRNSGSSSASQRDDVPPTMVIDFAQRLPEFEVIFRTNDPEDPKNWPTWYRLWAISTVSFSAWVVVLFSTSYTGAVPGLMEEFEVSKTYATMGLTTYLLGIAVGSLVVAPMSELYGRRIVYLCCLVLWAAFIVPCGLAGCLNTVLGVRFVGYVLLTSFFFSTANVLQSIVWSCPYIQRPRYRCGRVETGILSHGHVTIQPWAV